MQPTNELPPTTSTTTVVPTRCCPSAGPRPAGRVEGHFLPTGCMSKSRPGFRGIEAIVTAFRPTCFDGGHAVVRHAHAAAGGRFVGRQVSAVMVPSGHVRPRRSTPSSPYWWVVASPKRRIFLGLCAAWQVEHLLYANFIVPPADIAVVLKSCFEPVIKLARGGLRICLRSRDDTSHHQLNYFMADFTLSSRVGQRLLATD